MRVSYSFIRSFIFGDLETSTMCRAILLCFRPMPCQHTLTVESCSAPIIGEKLADLCHQMTLRGRQDESEIEYHFQIEVFG